MSSDSTPPQTLPRGTNENAKTRRILQESHENIEIFLPIKWRLGELLVQLRQVLCLFKFEVVVNSFDGFFFSALRGWIPSPKRQDIGFLFYTQSSGG
jgi:hypothetical protein